MILALNIGNGEIAAGVFRDDELLASFRVASQPVRTSDEYEFLFRSLIASRGIAVDNISGAVMGSVVPTITERAARALEAIVGTEPLRVGPGVRTGFAIKVDAPAELGADLAANAAGAVDTFGAPVIVADLGAATVICAVNEKKEYVGGSICAGIPMNFSSLGETGLLPNVAPTADIPPIGKNTADSMRSGIIRGQAFFVRGFCDTYRRVLGFSSGVPVVVSGEYAEAVKPFLPSEFVYVGDLTLRGLNVIYKNNDPKKGKNTKSGI